MTRFARLVLAAAVCLSPGLSRAVGPWTYRVTGPGGSTQLARGQIGQIVFFELDATAPDYVWGNVRVDFDPRLLECVSVEETPFADGFFTAWVTQPADPAYGGGGVLYRYDDGGLGSDWAKAWVAGWGAGAAGPVASIDNAAGVIRFYAMTNAGGLNGAAPLRLGFRVKRAGTAAFITSANDWESFGWPAAAGMAAAATTSATAAEATAAEATAAGTGYSWSLADLPYQLTSEVVIPDVTLLVAIDVLATGRCSRALSVIPVAILGGPGLDVAAIDPASVALEGMPVRALRRDGRLAAGYADANGDGVQDLVVGIANTLGLSGTPTVRLTGALRDGTPILGSDALCSP